MAALVVVLPTPPFPEVTTIISGDFVSVIFLSSNVIFFITLYSIKFKAGKLDARDFDGVIDKFCQR